MNNILIENLDLTDLGIDNLPEIFKFLKWKEFNEYMDDKEYDIDVDDKIFITCGNYFCGLIHIIIEDLNPIAEEQVVQKYYLNEKGDLYSCQWDYNSNHETNDPLTLKAVKQTIKEFCDDVCYFIEETKNTIISIHRNDINKIFKYAKKSLIFENFGLPFTQAYVSAVSSSSKTKQKLITDKLTELESFDTKINAKTFLIECDYEDDKDYSKYRPSIEIKLYPEQDQKECQEYILYKNFNEVYVVKQHNDDVCEDTIKALEDFINRYFDGIIELTKQNKNYDYRK